MQSAFKKDMYFFAVRDRKNLISMSGFEVKCLGHNSVYLHWVTIVHIKRSCTLLRGEASVYFNVIRVDGMTSGVKSV